MIGVYYMQMMSTQACCIVAAYVFYLPGKISLTIVKAILASAFILLTFLFIFIISSSFGLIGVIKMQHSFFL